MAVLIGKKQLLNRQNKYIKFYKVNIYAIYIR